MTTHIMSFTYEPKIEDVLSGECRQTIRKERSKRCILPEDIILFHGWKARPYRSKWSWRKKVQITTALLCHVNENGIQLVGGRHPLLRPNNAEKVSRFSWDSDFVSALAREDCIDPPTGEALKEVLKELNGPDWEGYYEVIRWEPVEEVKE